MSAPNSGPYEEQPKVTADEMLAELARVDAIYARLARIFGAQR